MALFAWLHCTALHRAAGLRRCIVIGVGSQETGNQAVLICLRLGRREGQGLVGLNRLGGFDSSIVDGLQVAGRHAWFRCW